MPPTTFRERFAKRREGVDREAFVSALKYVRDDGRPRRRARRRR